MARKRFTPHTRFGLLLACLLMITWSGFTASRFTIEAAPGDTIVYVNQAATGANNGTSWQNAYTDLQTALAAAQPNHSIWIAQGIYRPTSDLSDLAVARTISFEIPNGVELYGGFVGNEAELAERDWDLNKTILSGDLQNNDLTVGGVITTTTAIVGANTRNILKISDTDQSTVLDGLIITGGQTQASDAELYQNGAGIYIQDSKPTLRNLIFSGNSSVLYGGAIYNNDNSSPNISNSSFSGNTASGGGAIANNDNSSPDISSSSFSENKADWDGGAIYNTDNSSPNISNSSFLNNIGVFGGAISNNGNSKPTISNSIFAGNQAGAGGAILHYESDLSITNSAFLGNQATVFGGAIANANNGNSTISNSTFAGNQAPDGGAVYNLLADLRLNNSILWGNSSSVAISHTLQLSITYSLVEGCNVGGVWNSACGSDAGGNLADQDPLFVIPVSYTSVPTTTGDVRLRADSPAINAGNNALNSTSTDLDGKPRIIGSFIDLGAYEALPTFHSHVIGMGSFDYSPQLEEYPLNTSVTLTATANPGWSFAGWSGDLSGSSSPTTVLINDTKQITATFTNDPPTANAGADQTVQAGSSVTLDGSASFDADPTQTLSYVWTQTSGPAVTLTGANTAKPSFSAPSTAGVLTFELVVTDSLGLASSAERVRITVGATNANQSMIYLPIVRN